jgi:hypothetical protein
MDPPQIIRSQVDAARGTLEELGPEKVLGYTGTLT